MSSCGYSRIQRHNNVVIAIQNVLTAAGVNSAREKPIAPNTNIDLWYNNPVPDIPARTYVMADVTVIQAFGNDLDLPDTRTKLQEADRRKTNHHKQNSENLSATTVPLAFTTFGAMSASVKQFYRDVEHYASTNGTYFEKLDRRFSLVMRENVSMAIARHTARAAQLAAKTHLSRSNSNNNNNNNTH
jgi:hypothetical protein